MSKPIATAAAAAVFVVFLLVATVTGVVGAVSVASVGAGSVGGSTQPSAAALADIPPQYLAAYQAAVVECPGLSWTVLAGIGKVESDHGRSPLPGVHSGANFAGAAGPMQFLPATFAQYAAPASGRGPPSPYDITDATRAAARMLCDHGAAADTGLRAAIWAYNHSNAYVAQVLDRSRRYAAAPTTAPADDRAAPQDATVPDPSGTGGRITPRLATLYAALQSSGALTGGASCWDRHPQNPDSDHPRGRACDVFFNPRSPADVARGWQIARWLTANQQRYAVTYVIWQGQIWTAASPAWRVYESGIYGCPDPAEITGCHYDHIHISVR